MKSSKGLWLGLMPLGLAIALTACSGSGAETTASSDSRKSLATAPVSEAMAPVPEAAGIVAEVIRLVNAEREKQGLAALSEDSRLNEAAQFHARYMAQNDCMEHECPGGPTVPERLADVDYQWHRASENIAAGQAGPDEVVAGWMNSPGHRANILDPEVADVGGGYLFVAQDDGDEVWGHYWVLDFGAGP